VIEANEYLAKMRAEYIEKHVKDYPPEYDAFVRLNLGLEWDRAAKRIVDMLLHDIRNRQPLPECPPGLMVKR
jgi:hypothetical protein